MRIYKVGYNLTATKEGRCLNNCTGHGTCSEDAICHCQDNWTGGDCSVNAKGGCQPGSRKPMPMYVCILCCPHSCTACLGQKASHWLGQQKLPESCTWDPCLCSVLTLTRPCGNCPRLLMYEFFGFSRGCLRAGWRHMARAGMSADAMALATAHMLRATAQTSHVIVQSGDGSRGRASV